MRFSIFRSVIPVTGYFRDDLKKCCYSLSLKASSATSVPAILQSTQPAVFINKKVI